MVSGAIDLRIARALDELKGREVVSVEKMWAKNCVLWQLQMFRAWRYLNC